MSSHSTEGRTLFLMLFKGPWWSRQRDSTNWGCPSTGCPVTLHACHMYLPYSPNREVPTERRYIYQMDQQKFNGQPMDNNVYLTVHGCHPYKQVGSWLTLKWKLHFFPGVEQHDFEVNDIWGLRTRTKTVIDHAVVTIERFSKVSPFLTDKINLTQWETISSNNRVMP